MSPNDIRHVLRKWAHYEGWDTNEETLRAIAEDVLVLDSKSVDDDEIYLATSALLFTAARLERDSRSWFTSSKDRDVLREQAARMRALVEKLSTDA